MKPAGQILFCLLVAFNARAADSNWIGEWGAWKSTARGTAPSTARGTALQIDKDHFRLATNDGAGKHCYFEGTFTAASETDLKLNPKSYKRCAILLAQDPTAANRSLHLKFEGADCVRACNAEKALSVNSELALLHSEAFAEPLPWPQCQFDPSHSIQTICKDPALTKRYLETEKIFAQTRDLQSTFYVPEAAHVKDETNPLRSCDASEDNTTCIDTTLTQWQEHAATSLTSMRQLKAKYEADLKSTSTQSPDELKGAYSRKLKLKTASGDKFEAADDIKLTVEENELQFDALLNFFDEQECSLSGSARALKSGRFFYQGTGKAAKCRLLIFKEGTELVLADDPPNSCKSQCGKNGSFFNARFPLSSRK